MRIAQVSPLFESVPPKRYGGTERIVATLTEQLVRRGHEVTLFASGDSFTSAQLVPIGVRSLRSMGARETGAPHSLMFEKVYQLAGRGLFDVIHFHTEYLHLNSLRGFKELGVPTISTMHGRLDLPEYEGVFQEFADSNYVGISVNQTRAIPELNWVAAIHNGLNPEVIRPPRHLQKRDGYLAFLGRITKEKRVDRAIEIARAAGMRIKIAAKIESAIDPYVQSVLPLFDEPFVEFLGEICDADKSEFLGRANALVFPIDWPEPFGLAMIEALAAGTPVIAFGCGSVPEVIRHGETGFIVNSIEEAAAATKHLHQIRPEACRADFESRFTAEAMTSKYERAYQQVVREVPDASMFALREPSWLYELERRHAEGRHSRRVTHV